MIDRLDIHGYVDGELSQEQAQAVESAIEQDPKLGVEADTIRALKQALTTRAVTPDSREAWAACVRRLNELDKTKDAAKAKRIEAIVARFAPALCACLLACILILPRIGHRNHSDLVTRDDAQVIEGLNKTLTRKDTDFERYQVNRIRDSFRSTPDHLTPMGIKRGMLDGLPFTMINARDQFGNLDIYLMQEPLLLRGTRDMDGHPDMMVGNLNGINCVVRIEDQASIIVVAQRPYEELASIASEVTHE